MFVQSPLRCFSWLLHFAFNCFFVCALSRPFINWSLLIFIAEYLLVNLDFFGLGPFPWKLNPFTRNQAQEQYSLLDTIFDYIFYLGPPGKYL